MKKFILSSVVLLLFITINSCDKNNGDVVYHNYLFYIELVDENGAPLINNPDDLNSITDKMELKWVNPESSKYVEFDALTLECIPEKEGHGYLSLSGLDVIGVGENFKNTFSFDLICKDLFPEPLHIKTMWNTSQTIFNGKYPLDKIYINDVDTEIFYIEDGTMTVPEYQIIYTPTIKIKVNK